ncbi:MAG: hypothetical protein HQL24_04315 [Candidatus Omnitrophica bacterium]|nr:hypothetical protein [Candidatus Omnitrophota bacterium]
MNRKFFQLAAILGAVFFLILVPAYAQEKSPQRHTLTIFYSSLCSDCAEVREKVMPAIEKEFQGKVNFDYREIGDMDNYKRLLSLEKKYHFALKDILPVFYADGQFLNGEGQVKENLETFITALIKKPVEEEGAVKTVDLVQQFNSFTTWAIIGVGLIDGINPCAITVIVFFMSFLAFRGYQKREIAVIGLLFIGAVYLTYVLIGLGIFGFLYQMQGFRIISRIINITVGLISILFSCYATYDFIKFRKTKSTDDMLLHLPKSVQSLIHSVIRTHYTKQEGTAASSGKRPMLKLAITALVTGFLVSVLEAVCVVKIYLPTIVFVLKTTHLKMKALIYLLLYNLLFVLPLLVIFGFALAGTTSERFAALLKGNLGAIKILMAIMFLFLGVFLLWRA